MATEEHEQAIKKGSKYWNDWRRANPDLKYPNLSEAYLGPLKLENADLKGVNFCGAHIPQCDFRGANLEGADLLNARAYCSDFRGAQFDRTTMSSANLTSTDFSDTDLHDVYFGFSDLEHANFERANLTNASLRFTNLRRANLQHALLNDANLMGASLEEANLSHAQLTNANLAMSTIINADFTNTVLSGATVFGISVWKTDFKGAIQTNLKVSDEGEPTFLVDDIEVAQFIYLLLNRDRLLNVFDTVTRKGVLLLGRFDDGGLDFLQAIAERLRQPKNGGYLPLLFDFPRPEYKTYTETVATLAGLARFVIVELSGSSVPQELTATVDLHDIPFIPILEEGRDDWSMFNDFLTKSHVVEPVRYNSQEDLLDSLSEKLIDPAEVLVAERQAKLDSVFKSH